MATAFSTIMAVSARASDHLDSPATVANPAADIADVYAWTSPEDKQLNLIMTLQGHAFSDKVQYVIHIDSGKSFSHTTATTSIACSFAAASAVKCNVGSADSVSGDPTDPVGLEGRHHRFRVYAALRDDPFYNNVMGLIGAYTAAGALVKLTDLNNDASPFEVHLTDQDGRASFAMPTAGSWLLNVIWTKVLPHSEETDFETVFSSLSFGFPSDPP
jgi:hypothetical protein